MSHTREIVIYFPDGNPNGIKKAELMNRTCQVQVAQRTQLHQLFNSEYGQTGIYFLLSA